METAASLQSSTVTCRVASKRYCAGQQQQETQLTGKALGHGLEERRAGVALRPPEQCRLGKSATVTICSGRNHPAVLKEWRLRVQDLG